MSSSPRSQLETLPVSIVRLFVISASSRSRGVVMSFVMVTVDLSLRTHSLTPTRSQARFPSLTALRPTSSISRRLPNNFRQGFNNSARECHPASYLQPRLTRSAVLTRPLILGTAA